MNVKGANMNGASLVLSSFLDSEISHASLRRGLLSGSRFENIKGIAVDFRGGHLENSHWIESDLSKSLFMGVRAEKSKFINCNLQRANFWGSNLFDVDFNGSDLRGANLESTIVLFTRFENAKFNSKTRLPFDRETALAKGMVEVE